MEAWVERGTKIFVDTVGPSHGKLLERAEKLQLGVAKGQ
jgi:hypothetical protein